jgi:starch synthase
LKYGTLPIVRAIGGLDDTIDQYDEKTGDGTGFKFNYLTPQAIYDTIGWAVSTFYDRKKHLQKMVKRAMRKNYSWNKSAKKYVDSYKMVINKN